MSAAPASLEPRLLGVDYGDVRIGLAVSDDLGMLAHPLETLDRRQLPGKRALDRIAEIVISKGIAKIVLGIPLRADGSEGPAAAKVRDFLKQLRRALPETPIELVDESFTTTEAQAKLHAAGRRIKNSRSVIDQAAAVEILQAYLDGRSDPV